MRCIGIKISQQKVKTVLGFYLYYNTLCPHNSSIHPHCHTPSSAQYVSLSLDVILASLPVPVLGLAHKYFGPEECSFCKSSALNKAKGRQTKRG